jgi:hypothetical protein
MWKKKKLCRYFYIREAAKDGESQMLKEGYGVSVLQKLNSEPLISIQLH